MKLLPNTRRFFQACANTIGPVIEQLGPLNKVVETNLKKAILGEPEAPHVPSPMTHNQRFALATFRGFAEILTCVERLKDSETYVSRFPFSGTRVSRDAYLQMVVEAHLHEMHLLRERLIAFAKQIARAHKRSPDAKRFERTAKALEIFLLGALSRFSKVRGSHVHVQRYSHADIDRLRLISLLQKKGPDSDSSPASKDFERTMRLLGRHAIAESHDRLKEQARSWNRRASLVLEEYCKMMDPLLFSSEPRTLRYPEWKK